jgi:hypothetical protein
VGAVMSCTATDEPDVVKPADALQEFVPTVQLKVLAAQSAAAVTQVVNVGVLHTPLLHE